MTRARALSWGCPPGLGSGLLTAAAHQVLAEVTSWDLPPLRDRYRRACQSLEQGKGPDGPTRPGQRTRPGPQPSVPGPQALTRVPPPHLASGFPSLPSSPLVCGQWGQEVAPSGGGSAPPTLALQHASGPQELPWSSCWSGGAECCLTGHR